MPPTPPTFDRSDHPDGCAVTLDEFVRMPEEDDYRLELVLGRVVREPRPGARHGRILIELGSKLSGFAKKRGAGVVVADTGVRLPTDPPTVRVPDLAFVSSHSLPPEGLPEGFLESVPDLVVEIVSPSNTADEIRHKTLDYLDGGARLVWVVAPGPRRVTVHRSREDVQILAAEAGDVLEGEDALPGFRLPLSELFAD